MRDGSVSLVIRARCISCARQIAAERSPAEEFPLWCQASVQWIPDPASIGVDDQGPSAIVKRVDHA